MSAGDRILTPLTRTTPAAKAHVVSLAFMVQRPGPSVNQRLRVRVTTHLCLWETTYRPL
jgi:hypothetical protein